MQRIFGHWLQKIYDQKVIWYRNGYEACGHDICIDEVRNGKIVENVKKKQSALRESVEISSDYLNDAEIHEESNDDEETLLLRTSRFKRGMMVFARHRPWF